MLNDSAGALFSRLCLTDLSLNTIDSAITHTRGHTPGVTFHRSTICLSVCEYVCSSLVRNTVSNVVSSDRCPRLTISVHKTLNHTVLSGFWMVLSGLHQAVWMQCDLISIYIGISGIIAYMHLFTLGNGQLKWYAKRDVAFFDMM